MMEGVCVGVRVEDFGGMQGDVGILGGCRGVWGLQGDGRRYGNFKVVLL